NEMVVTKPHYEETFSASFANTVDNFRSVQPLVPRVFRYKVKLPTEAELRELGMEQIAGPLQIHAQINYEHFPPLFLRFISRATGPNGPAGHDLHLMDESRIDNLLKNNRNLASSEFTVQLVKE